MAFVLTPVYHTPQYGPFGFCSPTARSVNRYRSACQPRRVQISPLSQLFGQFDELLGEIDRQTQLEAHCAAQHQAQAERRQRKRALRAKFEVNQTEAGWKVDGQLQGFDQENLSIDVTSDHTVKIAGNTEWHAGAAPADKEAAAVSEKTLQVETDDAIAAPTEASTPTVAADSDTESHKSHQPTVEDDFEDLGAETASLRSAGSVSSTTSVREDKGKEKAADAAPEEKPQEQTEQQEQTQEQTQEQGQERVHGSFERTFKFPVRIDAANVRASFKDGALTILVPRAPVQETKRIAIQ